MPALDPAIVVIGAVGVGQGILLCALFAQMTRHNRANVGLSVYAGSLSLLLLSDVFRRLPVGQPWEWTTWAFDGLLFAPGAALWLYIRVMTQGSRGAASMSVRAQPVQWRYAIAFLPTVFMLAAMPLLPDGDRGLAPPSARDLSLPDLLQLLIALLYNLTFLALSVRETSRWRRAMVQDFSNTDRRNLLWFSIVLGLAAVLLFLWLLGWMLDSAVADLMSAVSLTVNFMALGLFGLAQSSLASPPRRLRTKDPIPTELAAPDSISDDVPAEDTSLLAPVAISAASAPSVKYAKSALSDSQIAQYSELLGNAMQRDKFFLESDLTLAQLASSVALTPHQLSQVINLGLKSSFYDYVNALRAREASRCLLDPAYDSQTVIEIAFASGFASKSTFNSVFKRHFLLAPTEYRKRRDANNAPTG